MPKIVYDAKNGITQSAGSGFQINDVGLTPSRESGTHTPAMFTLTCGVAHNGAGGAGEDWAEKYFVIQNRAGTKFGFYFDTKAADGEPAALAALSDSQTAIFLDADGDGTGVGADKTVAQIAAAIKAVVDAAGGAGANFVCIRTLGVLNIYVLKTGDMNEESPFGQGTLGDLTGTSLVLGHKGAGNSLDGSVAKTLTISAGTLESGVKPQVDIPDGTALGQTLFIQTNAAGAGVQVVLKGKWLDDSGGQDGTCTFAANTANPGMECVWVGSGRWVVLNSALCTFSA